MKKVTLAIAMAALVLFAGCKKDNETKGTTLKTSIEQNQGDSKTSLNPSNGAILWTAGDKILVNNGTASQTFNLTGGAGSKNGTFTYAGDYTFGASNVAVYPKTATISGNTVSLTLPEEQTFTAAGTFGNGANPMLGTLTDPENLTFTSLCGVLGVSLTGDDLAITGIEIVSNTANDKLNGLFEADYTATNPVLTPATGNSGTNRVRLDCATTLTDEAQEFYFVLPVGTLAEGFTMMYMVTTENTQPTSTTGFSATVPTAQGRAAGIYYVWYYAQGDATHTDSEISATAIQITVFPPLTDVFTEGAVVSVLVNTANNYQATVTGTYNSDIYTGVTAGMHLFPTLSATMNKNGNNLIVSLQNYNQITITFNTTNNTYTVNATSGYSPFKFTSFNSITINGIDITSQLTQQ